VVHWSVEPDPEPPSPPAAPERPPVEAIAEVLKALFLKGTELTTALLEALGRADTATLAKLFDSPAPACSARRDRRDRLVKLQPRLDAGDDCLGGQLLRQPCRHLKLVVFAPSLVVRNRRHDWRG